VTLDRAPLPEPAGAAEARAAMVAEVRAMALACAEQTGRPVMSPRVLAALGAVPRHLFLPGFGIARAYANAAQPIGDGQTISQPFVVALMTELADIGPRDSVLEIGTGSGYQAAILARLARTVRSIEILPALATRARRILTTLDCAVEVTTGDGRMGDAAHAPYDAILATAAAPRIPPALIAQLRDGGRLVMPLGPPDGTQVLMRGVRDAAGELGLRACLDVRFVPLTGGSE
jgi:protein-L-isoaspartate(D-aspartate) O-methyltransferase